jgi:asparagine synthase (glutamine-hydrolysing)
VPGIVGVTCREGGGDSRAILDALLGPMRRGGRLRCDVLSDPRGRWAMADLHLGIFRKGALSPAAGEVAVLFHGELSNEAALRALLAEGGRPSGEGVEALLAALYGRFGTGFAARLEGSFCAALVDDLAGRLVLASDRLGSHPLYWAKTADRLVFAGELKSLLCAPDTRRALDPRAVADYLAFGMLLGEKTLAEGAALLPPSSTLCFDGKTGAVSIERYERLEDAFSRPWEKSREEFLEAACEAFRGAVARSLSGGYRLGLALSGGLDSRAILSAAGPARAEIETYTLGVKGCADEAITEKLARIAGTRHRFLELDAGFLGALFSNLQRLVSLTDGMYLSHGLTEMAVLPYLEEAGFSVLLRGHCAELAKTSQAWPFHTDARIFAMKSREELLAYLLERLGYLLRGLSLRHVLSEEWAERVEGGARRSLEESTEGLSLSPAETCSYLYLRELHRRMTIPSLEIFRNFVEVRMPFADRDFLDLVLRAPPAWRHGTEIHRFILRKNDPALARVRNSNTGAPGDAGPLFEAFFDKLNTIFRMLNLRGYRHYQEFDAWMRRSLLGSVEAILFDPQTLARGVFREEGLRRLIDEVRRGRAERAYLLQALLTIELWQRENL